MVHLEAYKVPKEVQALRASDDTAGKTQSQKVKLKCQIAKAMNELFFKNS